MISLIILDNDSEMPEINSLFQSKTALLPRQLPNDQLKIMETKSRTNQFTIKLPHPPTPPVAAPQGPLRFPPIFLDGFFIDESFHCFCSQL